MELSGAHEHVTAWIFIHARRKEFQMTEHIFSLLAQSFERFFVQAGVQSENAIC
jgi:hypothetical protein